jgi:hypothetical protein
MTLRTVCLLMGRRSWSGTGAGNMPWRRMLLRVTAFSDSLFPMG